MMWSLVRILKKAEDLRGKKLAINSVGGGTWIGAMLWLEYFGIDPQRDQILLQSVGDQGVQSKPSSLESLTSFSSIACTASS